MTALAQRAESASHRRRLWWVAAGLSLGPAVSSGVARFAYGLLLPPMRADLGWSYTQAGWLNTANSIGYLLGALLTLAVISRVGSRRLFVWGMAVVVLALAGSALTRDIWALGAWRILAGLGGAPVFIAGGAMASALFPGDAGRSAMAIAIYFGGGGLGMLLSGLGLPSYLASAGASGWPEAWMMLALGSLLALVPSALAARAAPAAAPPGIGAADRMPLGRISPALVSYFLYGVGYLIYMTFLVAWMRDSGAGAALVAATWAVMGAFVMLSPPPWRPVLRAAGGGGAMALTLAVTAAGAALPLLFPSMAGFLASAALFGFAFFMVPAAVTAFSRGNLAERHWGPAIALFTVAFAAGQIVGPVGAGALSDRTGGTGAGLAVGAGVLVISALVAFAQRPLARPPAGGAERKRR